MGKKTEEAIRIIITAIISMLMTLVILSGTIIGKKADKEYVDKRDKEIIKEFKESDKTLKSDFLEQTKEIKELLKESRIDIKELLKKK